MAIGNKRTVREGINDILNTDADSITAIPTAITLPAVTSSPVDTSMYNRKMAYLILESPAKRGTATAVLESSPDETNWAIVNSYTLAEINLTTSVPINDHYPFMRVIVRDNTSTVTPIITGKGI